MSKKLSEESDSTPLDNLGSRSVADREVMQKDIERVLRDFVASSEKQLKEMPRDQLRDNYWHFKWNEERTIEHNTYEFFRMLEIYRSFCRRWEEHHSGTCMVVERVREKYLMPEIHRFLRKAFKIHDS